MLPVCRHRRRPKSSRRCCTATTITTVTRRGCCIGFTSTSPRWPCVPACSRQIDAGARGGLEGFEEELLGVLWWSEWLGETLDVNQASAGWSWFVNQWRALETERILLAAADRKSWTPRLAAFNQGGLRVVPISTSDELVREALSMRNCLNNYQDECLAREMEIYSVRDRETGKRKACIGFIFDEEGYPTLSDVKRFANTPPTAEIDALAGDIWGMLLPRVEDGQDG